MSPQPTLTKRQYLTLGSLLFGMFFGAGNLIFPIHMGQLAGSAWLPAAIGFLLSAVLLPLPSIMAISLTRASSMYDLARPAGHSFALFFLLATHASLGLLIASPRTATVTYSIGIAPFLGKGQQQIGLLIFSFIFFLTTFLLARNESKITTYIGKLLNPLLLILLAVIFFWALVIKGDIRAISFTSSPKLMSSNLINGFLQGYNTMDALAGLGFGVTIITALKLMGLHQASTRAKAVAKVGSLAMGLEALIYMLLILLGAISLGFSKLTANGGTAFNQIMTPLYRFDWHGLVRRDDAACLLNHRNRSCDILLARSRSSFSKTWLSLFPANDDNWCFPDCQFRVGSDHCLFNANFNAALSAGNCLNHARPHASLDWEKYPNL